MTFDICNVCEMSLEENALTQVTIYMHIDDKDPYYVTLNLCVDCLDMVEINIKSL